MAIRAWCPLEYSVLNEFRKFVAPELIFGCDARLLAGRYARKLGGRRVLLVSDPGVAAAGWTGEAAARLEETGLAVECFLGVSPNPRDSEVMAGAEVFRAKACDLIVAVGGGSPMDCAKGIGIVAANPGSIIDFKGVDRVPAPMPPLICIPTTAGTSADLSQFCIINHMAELVKIAIISKAVVPDVALIDPRTLVTMDPYLTACTGMDALVHAIEAFCSNAASPITDLHALEAIRLIHQNLRARPGRRCRGHHWPGGGTFPAQLLPMLSDKVFIEPLDRACQGSVLQAKCVPEAINVIENGLLSAFTSD